jgi:broad-specificity NMP kinase
MKNLIIIHGTMGIGKTTICKALYQALDRSVWLDGDWCWMMHPFAVNDENKAMVERNIHFLLRGFLENTNFDHVLFNWVIHTEDIMQMVLRGLEGCLYRLHRIALVCDAQTLEARLKQDGRTNIQESLNRLDMYRKMPSVQLDVTGKSVAQVVEDVLEIVRTERVFSNEERLLTGGNVNEVVRIGDAVHRSTSGSAHIHGLLRYLEAQGFPGAPRFLGLDAYGRERLSFLPGDVPGNAYPDCDPLIWSDEALVQTACLLRAYHDATRGYLDEAKTSGWLNPYLEPDTYEVICHQDAAPYNLVYRDGLPVALIDFDNAAPGPAVWDIVYTLYTTVPLSGFEPEQGKPSTIAYERETHADESETANRTVPAGIWDDDDLERQFRTSGRGNTRTVAPQTVGCVMQNTRRRRGTGKYRLSADD